jgi:hypothetical protein
MHRGHELEMKSTRGTCAGAVAGVASHVADTPQAANLGRLCHTSRASRTCELRVQFGHGLTLRTSGLVCTVFQRYASASASGTTNGHAGDTPTGEDLRSQPPRTAFSISPACMGSLSSPLDLEQELSSSRAPLRRPCPLVFRRYSWLLTPNRLLSVDFSFPRASLCLTSAAIHSH